MHPLLVISEPFAYTTPPVLPGLAELDHQLAFEAAAIGYNRKRQNLFKSTGEADAALKYAIVANEIPVFTDESVAAAKADIKSAQNRQEMAKFTRYDLIRIKYGWIGLFSTLCLVGYMVFFGLHVFAPHKNLTEHAVKLGLWFILTTTLPVWGSGYFFVPSSQPQLKEWQSTSLNNYGWFNGEIPDFMVNRCVSVAKLAPTVHFTIDYLGGDPFVWVHSCDKPGALAVCIGYFDEKDLASSAG